MIGTPPRHGVQRVQGAAQAADGASACSGGGAAVSEPLGDLELAWRALTHPGAAFAWLFLRARDCANCLCGLFVHQHEPQSTGLKPNVAQI